MMSRDHVRLGRELYPEFDELLKDWLRSDMRAGSKEFFDLQRYLWENKVGLLRLVEAVVAEEAEHKLALSRSV